jgi:hypothetical protein
MKIRDIVTEAKIDPAIEDAMEKQGYQLVGSGEDQDVYLAPDGTILKIFGTGPGANAGSYSRGQQSVIDFIKFCRAHHNNPFLPQFSDFERFVFKGKYYLQIRCERMFDLDAHDAGSIAQYLEELATTVEYHGTERGWESLNRYANTDTGDRFYRARAQRQNDAKAQLSMLLGSESDAKLLIQTIKQLQALAKQKRYQFDLNPDNFMLGSDGGIVINDPFFSGVTRY